MSDFMLVLAEKNGQNSENFRKSACAKISIKSEIFKKGSPTLFAYMLWSSGANFSLILQKLRD